MYASGPRGRDDPYQPQQDPSTQQQQKNCPTSITIDSTPGPWQRPRRQMLRSLGRLVRLFWKPEMQKRKVDDDASRARLFCRSFCVCCQFCCVRVEPLLKDSRLREVSRVTCKRSTSTPYSNQTTLTPLLLPIQSHKIDS